MKDRPKKSDKLEVRLSYETKQAFLQRCRIDARSASEAMRDFIEDYLAQPLVTKPASQPQRLLVYAAAAALALIGMTALSAGPGRATPDLAAIFRNLDADGNSRLSEQEFTRTTGTAFGAPKVHEGRATLSAEYLEINTNGDDFVSLAEFAAFNRAAIEKRFLALDADSNGRLTLAELQRANAPMAEAGSGFAITGAADRFFVKVDANKDGAISPEDFSSLP